MTIMRIIYISLFFISSSLTATFFKGVIIAEMAETFPVVAIPQRILKPSLANSHSNTHLLDESIS